MNKITILVGVFIAWRAEAQDFMSLYNFDQLNVLCIGVRCPSERPYCVVRNRQTECVAHSSSSGNRRVSRLSRPPAVLPQQQLHRQQQEQQQESQIQNDGSAVPGEGLFTEPQVTITLKGQNSLDVPNNNPSAPLPPLHITRTNGRDGASNRPEQSGSTQPGTNGQNNVGSRFPSGLKNPFSSGLFTQSNSVNDNNNKRGGPFNLEVHNVAPDFCFLRPEKGRCRGYLSRYYYNQETGQCQSFSYGGCGGNANRFETLVDCFKVCALPHGAIGSSPSVFGNARLGSPTPTELPTPFAKPTDAAIIQNGKALGNDNINNNVNSINRNTDVNDQTGAIFGRNQFFSDPNGGLSLVSVNSAAGDKKVNNDDSRRVGQQRLSSTADQQQRPQKDSPRACNLDVDIGQCQGRVTRVYFNRNTGRCEIFDFGGCGGNANNFLSFPECNRACGRNTGRVRRPVDPMLDSSFLQGDIDSPRITNLLDDNDRFNSANSNFNTRSVPSRDTNKSNSFNGNANPAGLINANIASFPRESPDQFRSFTSQRSGRRPETCYQPANQGPCLAAFNRYYFNKTEGQCLVFLYGGCGGNQNNYASREDCVRECNEAGQVNAGASNGISGIFSQGDALRSYPQNNNFPQQNRSFIREGLNRLSSNVVFGNGDQQDRLRGISKSSSGSIPFPTTRTTLSSNTYTENSNRPQPCELGPFPGPCRAFIPRIYFNSQTGRCEQFVYGGCRSNGNNFRSSEECIRTCGGRSSNNLAAGNSNRGSIGASGRSRDRFGMAVDPLPFSSFRVNGDQGQLL